MQIIFNKHIISAEDTHRTTPQSIYKLKRELTKQNFKTHSTLYVI